jgi:hypothetical protein
VLRPVAEIEAKYRIGNGPGVRDAGAAADAAGRPIT